MKDLTKAAEAIVDRINAASPSDRLELQPQLAEALRQMQEHGIPVPARMRALDEELVSEALEDRFDNVPL